MKTNNIIRLAGILAPVLLLFHGNGAAMSQDPYAGTWEGAFMGQFKTLVRISASPTESYVGNITMFDAGNLIQDDPISEIRIADNRLTFHIRAKETDFEGLFNEEVTGLSGKFIFPDGSEHPIMLRKKAEADPSVTRSEDTYLEHSRKKYSATQVKEDLDSLMRSLEKYHPRLYASTKESDMRRVEEAVRQRIEPEMSLEDCFRLMAPLVEKVGCSHTGIRLPEHYGKLAEEHGNYLPLQITCLQDRAFYLSCCDKQDPGIPPGSEILGINGVPWPEILEQMLSMIPSEGHCMTTKYQEINRHFHSWFYLLDHSGTFDVEFRTPSSGRTVTFLACSLREINPVREETGTGLPISFSLDREKGAAILKVASFGVRDLEEYIRELDSLFRMLQYHQISDLAVDLRGNSGGHPIFAAQLFSYLSPGEFTYFRRNTEADEFEPLYHPMPRSPFAFSGKLCIFVDGACLSTTGHLISLIRYHTDAFFIGEEPGSSFSCNDFSIRLTLSNTSIEANIPRTTFETAVEGFVYGESFQVDELVPTTLSDILAAKDPYLLFYFEWLDKQRRI